MQTPSDGYGEKPYQKNNRLNDYKRLTRKNNKQRLTNKRNTQSLTEYSKPPSMCDNILMMNVSCRFLLIEWANL